jgi:hypothetical protein
MFLKFNLIAGFSSLLDIIVVDNINTNYHRFELRMSFEIFIMVIDSA